MNKFSIFLISSFLFFSIFGLFQIKFRVQYLNKDVSELKRQLEQEKESIHILKAEWAYLNQPQRLRELAKRYLNLDDIKISQIRNFDDCLKSQPIIPSAEQAEYHKLQIKNKLTKNVRWNYKDKNLFVYHPNSKKLLVSISGN